MKTDDRKAEPQSGNNSRGGSRRRLLKALAAGGGVAVSAKALSRDWTRPVVEAAILPAHAQTSCTHSDYYGQPLLEFEGAMGSIQDELLDLVAPRAKAGGAMMAITTMTAHLCIHCNGDGTVNVRGDATGADSGFELLFDFSGNNIPLGPITNLSDSCETDASAMIQVQSLGAQAVGRLYIQAFGDPFEGKFQLNAGPCPALAAGCFVTNE